MSLIVPDERNDGNATTEAAAAHRQMPPVQKPKSKSAQAVGSRILRPQLPAARGRAQSRFKADTLTPINMLVRDLDTVRVRNAIRAEILAILRDMGLNLRPLRRTNRNAHICASYNGSRKGPVPNAGAGARS
jgi:hypothetical protein